jgi:hypothetical protein
MSDLTWLLLIYKVPSEPASRRTALWRRLKAAGALYMQGGVCLLPKTDENVRQLKIIENEIRQMSGESILLDTAALDNPQREKVIARFNSDRDEQYRELIERCEAFEAEIEKETLANKFTYAELEENDDDLKKLQAWYEKIEKLDFYKAPEATEACRRLKQCEELLETFAQRVYAAHAEDQLPEGP